MLDDIKSYILEHVDPSTYYKSRFPAYNPRVKANVKCVFHAGDKKPSLSINLRNGGAKCFAASCHASVGNIVHFEAAVAVGKPDKVTPRDELRAARALYTEFIRPIVPDATLQKFRKGIDADDKLRQSFSRSTGISVATIDRFGIGYDVRSRRYTFPIPNAFGDVVNVRFYRPKGSRKSSDVKIYSLVEGKDSPDELRYGNIELFPWTDYKTYSPTKGPLFIMASEKETMLARQLNLQAICSTAGEGAWLEEWSNGLTGYEVVILFDPDKGGRKASEKLVATLQSKASRVIALELPFASDYRGDRDFDDWILSKSGNQFALLSIAKKAFEAGQNSTTSLPSPSENRTGGDGKGWVLPRLYSNETVELPDIRNRTEFLNYCVKTRGIIAAVATKSYDIPWRFKIKTKTGFSEITLPIGRELVSLVGASDSDVSAVLESNAGIKVKEYQPLEFVSISEVELVPMADIATENEGRYTVQRSFVLGKSIESNTPYELTVIPTTITRTQEKVAVIVSAVEVSRAIDTWTFNRKEQSVFETFQPSPDQSVDDKLYTLAEELALNHTKIYSRPDWHIVALLTWFSPLAWYFPGETDLQRGWINALSIGDTQTGKSKVVATLQRLLKLGDIVNAENCTFVGLVGGAIKTGSGQMMLRWGRIPLCDRKLVIIEELSGLSVTEISNMSEVRSRGIARLDKGGLASQTPARTRLIALSNVRDMRKNLAQYLSGVRALQELIGHPEDISRFDLIATLVDSEVSSDVINSPTDATTEATFTPEQLRRLCQFVWALKPNQIRFSDDAYISCLDWTKKMQEIYHPSVPIFKAASGRLLLARIAASIAALQFSWDGEALTVEDVHVEAAVNLLRSLYDKPSFGYLEYSEQMQDREEIKDGEAVEKVVKRVFNNAIMAEIIENLIHAAKFSRDELAAIASIQLFAADDVVGALLRGRVIRKGEANTWEITKAGKEWLASLI